jgi:hypothetical protein
MGQGYENAAGMLERDSKNQWNQGTRKVIDSTQIFNRIKHQRSLRNSLIWPTHEVSNR